MEQDSDESISPEQEKYLLQTLPDIQKIISRKLGKAHRAFVEDIKQRVFLKLWRWKLNQLKQRENKNLSDEEWQKIAHVTTQNEVTEFFREKYTRRDVVFSQMDESTKQTVFSAQSNQTLEGNSQAEICSQMKLVWKSAQSLSLRQKYAYFLQFRAFIIEFITCKCCRIEELAEFFEIDKTELSQVIDNLPFSDDEIGRRLEIKLGGETLQPKQIWEARAKAKIKLARNLSEYVCDERTFVQRRS